MMASSSLAALAAEEAVVDRSSVMPVPVPPILAPPGAPSAAMNETTEQDEHGSAEARRLRSTVSNEAMQLYRLIMELRRTGFRCPGGRYFPPNTGALELDCRLWKASYEHSFDMAQKNYFSHISAGSGEDPYDRTARYGLGTFSETLAASPTASSAIGQWRKSDGHCTIMMDAKYNRIGVGHAYNSRSDYKHYWTAVYAADNGAVSTNCYSGGSGGVNNPIAPTQSPPVGPCDDMEDTCQYWASSGYCAAGHAYQSYMYANCKLSCGWCSSSSAEGTSANFPAVLGLIGIALTAARV